jgi:hypothetical protein
MKKKITKAFGTSNCGPCLESRVRKLFSYKHRPFIMEKKEDSVVEGRTTGNLSQVVAPVPTGD